MNIVNFLIQEWILVSLLVVFAGFYFYREKVTSGQSISPSQLTLLVNKDLATIVDIRPPAEFKLGHLINALNIPYEKVNSQLEELEKHKTKTIILVDKLGQYTGTVGKMLMQKGFQVKRLSGGITEWQQQNLPLIKSK